GYSQKPATPNTNGPGQGTNAVLMIQIDLTNGLGTGLNLTGSNITVRGLVLNRAFAVCITIAGATNTIAGNFIGTNFAGSAAGPGNGTDGIFIASDSVGHIIGGANPADRNLISANGAAGIRISSFSDATILGNQIGTNAAGTAALPNVAQGIAVAGGSATIGSAAPGARNVISGNGAEGILLTGGGSGSVVAGNYVGTDVTGTGAIPNSVGITAASTANTIGGSTSAAGNLISGNTTDGIVLSNQTGPSAIVQSNRIGTDASGAAGIGGQSTAGIHILTFASGNVIGAGFANRIAFNGGTGVLVDGVAATGGINNFISGNSIVGNGGLGIKLGASPSVSVPTPNDPLDADSGPNGLQNYPTVTSASISAGKVTASGTLNSVPSTNFMIDLYSSAACDPSGNGEGDSFLGSTSVMTDVAGNATFGPVTFTIPASQSIITSTASLIANTSEFSPCFTATGACPPITVLPATLPQGTQGTPYTQTFTASGGASPYTFTVSSGSLPPGLTLATGGLLSGMPTASGTFAFTITAKDINLCVGSASYSLVIVSTGCATPPAPSLSAAPGTVSLGQKVTLSWTETLAKGQGSYTVQVRSNTGGFASVASIAAAGSGVATFHYAMLGLPGSYDFRILAVPSCNPSLFSMSNVVTVVETGPCPSAPPVTGVTVNPTSAKLGDTVTLAWNPAVLFSGQYGVFQSLDGGQTFSLVATTTATSATVTVEGDPGNTLTFEVEALGCIYSQQSNFVSVQITLPTCDPPGAVSNIQLRASGITPARPPAPTEYIAVDWHAPATGTVPLQYSVRVNGGQETFVTALSALLLPRGQDLDPIQVFVRAQACSPLQDGPEVASDPVALFLTPPQSSFTVSADARVGAAVTFTDTSSPQATSWFWVFDDGATETVQSPSHTFAAAGPHTVSLIASNGAGSSTSTQTFTVAPAGTARVGVSSVVALDASHPGRRRARVVVTGPDALWVALSNGESREAIVFLRLLSMDGRVRLERRLSVPAGGAGVFDVGAWGVTGDVWLELVSDQKYRAQVTRAGRSGVPEVAR
ncbi:MAG TPA: PKD domain-containing protein, partial [Thermoanaerobaculia bacterium]|nr:PKD domain-containing protein [Thermoanaerobaculia bacterium]